MLLAAVQVANSENRNKEHQPSSGHSWLYGPWNPSPLNGREVVKYYAFSDVQQTHEGVELYLSNYALRHIAANAVNQNGAVYFEDRFGWNSNLRRYYMEELRAHFAHEHILPTMHTIDTTDNRQSYYVLLSPGIRSRASLFYIPPICYEYRSVVFS